MRNLDIKNNNSLAPCGRERQSGRSMIEMLGVLAIIGVLSVGGIAGYSKAMMKYRINKTIEQVTLIAGNVRSFFAKQGNYDGVDCICGDDGCGFADNGGATVINGCPIIKKAKIFPDEMLILDSEGNITGTINAFGGMIESLTESKSISNDNKAFLLHFYDIPQEACVDLLTQDWSNAGVNGIYTQAKNSAYYVARTPIEISDAVTMCNNDLYYLTLYFDVDINSTLWKDFEKHCSISVGGC